MVHPNAVTPSSADGEYGTYDLFVPPNLDDRLENVIFDCIRDAIVGARAAGATPRPSSLDALMRVTRAPSVTVTRDGERPTVGVFNRVLPFAFVALLLISVLMGGQGLVTSTIEEKTSRVIEVLLSAVSPFELLAGKLLGQMGVSLVVLGIYIGLAFMMLLSFAVFGLLDLSLVVYLFIFFVITYLTIGSAMMAVGAAVNEMREAQSLMMPIILVLMVPWMLAEPIARRAELDVQHRDQLHPAGQHLRDAAAHDLQRAAAGVAGLADDRHRCRRRRGVDLVRREGLHHRPADVRQAARCQNPGALDSGGLSV